MIESLSESKSVDGVVALGSMGEFYAVNRTEFERIAKTIISAASGRLTTVIGCSFQNLGECLYRTKYAEDTGFDGAMIMPPYYLNVNSEEALKHYQAVDRTSRKIQIMAYNFPPASKFNINPEFWKKLVTLDSVKAVKESNGDLFHITRVLSEFGDRVNVFAGSEAWLLPMSCLGAKGVVSIFGSSLPEYVRRFYDACFGKNISVSARMHKSFVEASWFIDLYNEVAWLKDLNEICGWKVGAPRPPYSRLSRKQHELLKAWVIKVRLKNRSLGESSRVYSD